MSRSAAQKSVKKWILEKTYNSKPKPGRPALLSARDSSMMVRTIMKEPSISSTDLARDLNSIRNRLISPATIRRHLHNSGLRWYSALKKPLLTRSMKTKRLEWCKKYSNEPIEFWENILFSDETLIAINLNSIMNRIRRYRTQSPFDPRYLQKTVKFPLRQMFWGSFSSKKVGSLIPVTGMMTGEKYISTLDQSLMKDLHECGASTFVDDSAPCHR